ncbi:MAG TPA: hypothetical protein PK659_05500 [Methanothrix sp.]|nr:hypothetical protein [Methanothrix sp.]HOK58521.1 hypothetical protein [Methanothrix sp.]HOL43690.1 hypothetical protein [Methanothrix sp.]
MAENDGREVSTIQEKRTLRKIIRVDHPSGRKSSASYAIFVPARVNPGAREFAEMIQHGMPSRSELASRHDIPDMSMPVLLHPVKEL